MSTKSLSSFAVFLVSISYVFIVLSCDPCEAGSLPKRVVGVKIYERAGDFDSLFRQWRDIGINTAFIGTSLAANREFMSLANQHGIKTLVIFPVFFNPEALKSNPDLYAITAAGNKAEKEWVQFVCPSRQDYLIERLAYLRKVLEESRPDGLSIDFIRYFTFWEKVWPETGPEESENTCFCPVCLGKFQEHAKVRIPETAGSTRDQSEWILRNHRTEWIDWKCATITRAVREIASEARKTSPGIVLNVHLVPWRESDFDGAIRLVAGQEVSALTDLVDYISPMAYAHMVKRDPVWIHSVVDDLAKRSPLRVLPSIQVAEAYRPEKLSVAEFEQSLKAAIEPPSIGVVFWNWDTLAKDPERQAIVRALLRSFAD